MAALADERPDAVIDIDRGTTIGKIERLSPELDALIPEGAKIEVLADGFKWAEGPVWHKESDKLLFSDIPRNAIYSWSESQGIREQIKPAGYTGSSSRGGESGSNGLAIDSQGRLVLAQHGDRRIARLITPIDLAPTYETVADKIDGKRFNSPNDLVIHSSGTVYFTDPAYGMEKGWEDSNREVDYCGVYSVTSEGKVAVMTDALDRPNGIGLSPDESILYVGQSYDENPVIMAYRLQADGTIDSGTVFFDARSMPDRKDGAFDGLKVDEAGNVFATGPGGVLVITPEGKHLGTIRTGVSIANCAFGEEGSTLYMTSDRYLCRVKVSTKGRGF